MAELAVSMGRDAGGVATEAAGYLREMGAVHSPRVMGGWSRFSRWMFRAHDLLVDEEAVRRLRRLDGEYSLLFLFSHRSYLDGAAVPLALDRHDIQPAFTLGGANLNFFPVGQMARRSGILYIRRSTQDLPVYKLALRAYIGQLIRNRRNLSWSIEGGRTRTGKLRPPTYGIVRYVVDAVEAEPDIEAVIVPVSIVYEQLHEVGLMTAEARGGRKRPEDVRWLVNFARQQTRRLGRAYLDFGEPLPLREHLAQLRAEDPDGRHIVERVALDTSHRINRATPVTATAVVCLAMLAADRALTLDGVLATVAPMAGYIASRGWPVAGAANLTDRATIGRTLRELSTSGVLACYDGGTDTVWHIRPGQHLVAAFYRNAAIHMLVDRAIGELSLVAATEGGPDALATATTEALRLRDLLKFDFFFARRRDFATEMAHELAVIDPTVIDPTVIDPTAGTGLHEFTPADARRWLQAANPLVSPLVLRPFLDAYHLVADRLAAHEDTAVEETPLLDQCLRVGRQWAMQGRLGSEESVSLELFKPALRLAAHRDLLTPTAPHLHKRRTDFRDEILRTLHNIDVVA
ncbi:lysophospholipid acyltransferase, partial [Virgisporangium ochraceum]|uniref:lysophospholipid acyltransferase n=1 Tax=Virgisporangium ochraceum TaxID=65505 RepID=UPI0023B250FD